LCGALGGGDQPPAITIKHTKGAGSISVSMADHLSDGRTIDHGTTSVSADPSGTTHLNYSFRAPCNRRTAQGLRSAYYVTAASGNSTKPVFWGPYPYPPSRSAAARRQHGRGSTGCGRWVTQG